MSMEHTNQYWKQSLRTFSIGSEWWHTFTVNGIDIRMEAAGKGSFSCHAPLRVDGYPNAGFSGNHWNGNDEPFPVEVRFDVDWHEVDGEQVASLEKQVEEASKAHMDALDKVDEFVPEKWEEHVSSEDALNWLMEDAEDAEDFLESKANDLGDRLDGLEWELEKAKDGEHQIEQVIVCMNGRHWYVDAPDEIPSALVDALYEDVVAISEELRENQILVYTEKREVTA